MQPLAPPQLGHYLVWAPPARRDPPPHAAAAQPPSRNDAVGNGAPARAFFCRGKRPASSPRPPLPLRRWLPEFFFYQSSVLVQRRGALGHRAIGALPAKIPREKRADSTAAGALRFISDPRVTREIDPTLVYTDELLLVVLV